MTSARLRNNSPVRVGDIIPHETPDNERVRTLVAHLRSGGTLPPLDINRVWKEHWKQGPGGMVSTGFGYGLWDGHHRLEAYKIVFGNDYMAPAKSNDICTPSVEMESTAPGRDYPR